MTLFPIMFGFDLKAEEYHDKHLLVDNGLLFTGNNKQLPLTDTSQRMAVLSFEPVASFVPSCENRKNQTCQ